MGINTGTLWRHRIGDTMGKPWGWEPGKPKGWGVWELSEDMYLTKLTWNIFGTLLWGNLVWNRAFKFCVVLYSIAFTYYISAVQGLQQIVCIEIVLQKKVLSQSLMASGLQLQQTERCPRCLLIVWPSWWLKHVIQTQTCSTLVLQWDVFPREARLMRSKSVFESFFFFFPVLFLSTLV